jgi:hypothetical protein
MRSADLEMVAHRALRALPQPRAPHTLLPRVLTAVTAWSLRPWYARAWFTWPREGQVTGLAALCAAAAGGLLLLAAAAQAAVARLLAVPGGRVMHAAAAVADGLAVAADAGQVVWGTLVQPIAPYAAAIVILMCVACAVFGLALNQVVLGRMSER